MPDWSYQTVFKPILFRLPPCVGRSLALGTMGRLGRHWLGRQVIEFMGHFKLEPELQRSHTDLTFPSPVGIGCRLDPALQATQTLAEFGVGLLEIGPVSAAATEPVSLDLFPDEEAVEFSPNEELVSLSQATEVLNRPLNIPVFVRIRADDPTAPQVIEQLGDRVAGMIVEFTSETSNDVLPELMSSLRERSCRILLQITHENIDQVEQLDQTFHPDGFAVEGKSGSDKANVRYGVQSFPDTVRLVEQVRTKLDRDMLLIATGGIHEPGDGIQLLQAGADLILVDTGLMFSGPGLPKRINDAVLSYLPADRGMAGGRSAAEPPESQARPTRMSWFWMLLMGSGLILGGVLAFLIAVTRVVLPYDESQSGLTRADLMRINDKLLDFMQHDRVTVAGTMFGLGILYIALAWCGSRRGWHWANIACIASAFAGFFSFFLFLGFGYFDPFHAFVTAILFQLLVMSLHGDLPPVTHRALPELRNDAAWKRSQWGQLVLVIHGAALIVAGVTISGFGISQVFVPEDLEFMEATYDEICTANPMLLPLVAHDRATFGGMTLSTGITILLCALWGFRRGNRWLWRALMLGGTVCYLTTLWVHWKVGYTDLTHLIPVYAGLTLLWLTGWLSREHLCTVRYRS